MGSNRVCENDNLRSTVITTIAEVLAVEITELDLRQSFLFHVGHSLTAISLSSGCKLKGILLSVKAILRNISITELADLAYAIDGHGSVVLDRDHDQSSTASYLLRLQPQSLEAKVFTEDYEMTEMQMALLSGSQRDSSSNMIQFFDTFSSVHVPAMKKAWHCVVEMEPVFRLWRILSFDRETATEVVKSVFQWSDVIYGSSSEYQVALDTFPIETSPTMSFKAVRLKQDSKLDITTIVWNVHHVLIDGYSASLVYQKVRRAAEGHGVRPGRSFFKVASELKMLQKAMSVPYQRF
ncbi:MAG: hypothetical protein Q9187_002059 [Circinaria calcarea]